MANWKHIWQHRKKYSWKRRMNAVRNAKNKVRDENNNIGDENDNYNNNYSDDYELRPFPYVMSDFFLYTH